MTLAVCHCHYWNLFCAFLSSRGTKISSMPSPLAQYQTPPGTEWVRDSYRVTRHCRCANMLILVCTHRKPAIVWRLHKRIKWKLSTIATKKKSTCCCGLCYSYLWTASPPKHWGKTNMWVIEMKGRRDFPHPQGRKTRSGPMASLPTVHLPSAVCLFITALVFTLISVLVSLAGGSLPKCLPKAGLYYVCMSASKESS